LTARAGFGAAEDEAVLDDRQISPATLRPHRYPFEISAKFSAGKRLLGLEKTSRFLYKEQVILIVDCDLI
jgi:hypothetical protein